MNPRSEDHDPRADGRTAGYADYSDFTAARERFFARLAEQSEIHRLERALALPDADPRRRTPGG